MSGGYENLPFPLPDGTKIKDYASLNWSYTYEDDKYNWKQIKEVVMALLGVGVLMGILADDISGAGATDDLLIPGILTDIAKNSPTIYNFLMKVLPFLEKIVQTSQTCL